MENEQIKKLQYENLSRQIINKFQTETISWSDYSVNPAFRTIRNAIYLAFKQVFDDKRVITLAGKDSKDFRLIDKVKLNEIFEAALQNASFDLAVINAGAGAVGNFNNAVAYLYNYLIEGKVSLYNWYAADGIKYSWIPTPQELNEVANLKDANNMTFKDSVNNFITKGIKDEITGLFNKVIQDSYSLTEAHKTTLETISAHLDARKNNLYESSRSILIKLQPAANGHINKALKLNVINEEIKEEDKQKEKTVPTVIKEIIKSEAKRKRR